MRKKFFLTVFVLLLATAAGNARDQWVIGDKAYDVDTDLLGRRQVGGQ